MADVILTNTRQHDIRLNYSINDNKSEIKTINLPSVQLEQVTGEDGVSRSKKVTVPVKVDSAIFDQLKKREDKVFQYMLDEGYVLAGEPKDTKTTETAAKK